MVSSIQWLSDTSLLLLHSLIVLVPIWFFVLLARYTPLKLFTIAKILAFPRSQWRKVSFVDEPNSEYTTEDNVSVNGECTKLVTKDVKEKTSALKFILVTITFLISFMMYNFYQEKILNTEYVHDKITNATNSTKTFQFSDTQFLLFMNRSLGFFVAISTIIIIKISDSRRSVSKFELFRAPLYVFSLTGLFACVSNWALVETLLYVELPMQLIAQAFRIVPMMAIGQLFVWKKYKFFDYFVCAAIIASTSLFLYEYTRCNENNSHAQTPSLINGLSLIVLFLTTDAINVNYLNMVFEKYSHTVWESMAGEDFVSTSLVLASMIESGTFMDNIYLLTNCRSLLIDIVMISIMFAVLQTSCIYAIFNFGAVGYAILCALGLVLSLINSSVIYSHHLSIIAICSAIFLFSFVFLHTYVKAKK